MRRSWLTRLVRCSCSCSCFSLLLLYVSASIAGGDRRHHGVVASATPAVSSAAKRSLGANEESNIERIVLLKRRKISGALPSLLSPLYSLAMKECMRTVGKPHKEAMKTELMRRVGILMAKSNSTPTAAIFRKAMRDLEEAVDYGWIYVPWPYLPSLPAVAILVATGATHALILLLQRWSVDFKAHFAFERANSLNDATDVLVVPLAHRGKSALCSLAAKGEDDDPQNTQNRTLDDSDDGEEEGTDGLIDEELDSDDGDEDCSDPGRESGRKPHKRHFLYQHRVFFLQDDAGDVELSMAPLPVSLQISHYFGEGSLGLTKQRSEDLLRLYGRNSVIQPPLTLLHAVTEEFLSPLTVFRLFSHILKLLDYHWSEGLVSLTETTSFAFYRASHVHKQRKRVSTPVNAISQDEVDTTKGTAEVLSQSTSHVFCWRDGKWTTLESDLLLPGDVVSIGGPGMKRRPVPADILLLRGSAAVDESSITGESVPQVKVGIKQGSFEEGEVLDMHRAHRGHTLCSGTTLIHARDESDACESPEEAQGALAAASPGAGCIGLVLRTGFYSTQGDLLRLMEYGSEPIRDDVADAGRLLGFLLSFATLAASQVLRAGLKGPTPQNPFRLAVQCVRILVAVVPTDIHMQMTHSVGQTIGRLSHDCGISCAEPWRVPAAGRVDLCLFDKTGTLTSDQLDACLCVWMGGEVTLQPQGPIAGDVESQPPLEAQLVLAGCQSLVEVEGELIGDPMEISAVKTVGWALNASSSDTSVLAPANSTTASSSRIDIWHRHGFDPDLQRMSVIAEVYTGPQNSSGIWCLTKGSPESIKSLLDPSHIPEWYDSKHREMTEGGQRVIALAYRPPSNFSQAGGMTKSLSRSLTRGECEQRGSMRFAGLVAFECRVRGDTKAVIDELKNDAGCGVIMLTGDGPHTAAAVAREVGILDTARPHTSSHGGSSKLVKRKKKGRRCIPLLLSAVEDDSDRKGGSGTSFMWVPLLSADIGKKGAGERSFFPKSMEKLAKKHDLCVTGPALQALLESYPGIRNDLNLIRVFSRMTPELKETVAHSFMDNGHCILMCGDGGNDVGALRQANVGLALLSGFGNANTGIDEPVTSRSAQTKTASEKQEARRIEIERVAKAVQAERDESGANIFVAAMRVRKREVKEAIRRRDSIAASAAADMGDLGESTSITTGDASIAAPFTSKKPSISAVADILRYGKHTGMTVLQTYQMTALEALISSYDMSVLFSDRVRWARPQIFVLGACSVAVMGGMMQSRPLRRLSSIRPPRSIFHPSLIYSILGQAACHIGATALAVEAAKRNTAPSVAAAAAASSAAGKFTPNLVSNVVFLVGLVQSASVSLVNYKGYPFMTPLVEMPLLVLSSVGSCIIALVLLLELMPSINSLLMMAPWPKDSNIRLDVLGSLFLSLAGPMVWDRIMVSTFNSELRDEKMKYKPPANAKAAIFRSALVALPIIHMVMQSLK